MSFRKDLTNVLKCVMINAVNDEGKKEGYDSC
jgi:hypothetical protein